MKDQLDVHGQSIIRQYNKKQRHDRSLDELIGLAKGMVADGIINQHEAEFLQKWLQCNNEIADTWPANVLYNRTVEMLCDGVLDHDEQMELLELLTSFTGQIPVEKELENMSSTLPLDSPAPALSFNGRTFCFTGKLVSGTRKDCHQTTVLQGGQVSKTVTLKTDYLVIGVIGSRDWAHTSYGRKIERAMEIKNQGHQIAIVSEDHWAKTVYGTQPY